MKKALALATMLICATASAGQAGQSERPKPSPRSTVREDALDPSPVNPAVDPNTDLFINDWHNATPRTAFGTLVYHDILTRLDSADPVHPDKKGAVLTGITAVSYVTLAPGATASGRLSPGQRQSFYTTAGSGRISSGSRSYDLSDGTGFTLTPEFDFRITNTGRVPLAFYVRAEPLPPNQKLGQGLVVVNRFDHDRKIGAHWVHICNAGPEGMLLCTVAPNTMPQPHSHPGEEAWILVKGDSILSLGKSLIRMHPGQAYKIPPTGLAAHSNLNLGEEPIELIYMGPAVRGNGPGGAPDGIKQQDFAQLDNARIDPQHDPDIDMFMGNWHDAYPRIEHGNLYFRDMLTALQGDDDLHPLRKGAVLTDSQAVSYAMLEPRSTAHPVGGDLNGVQEVYVVNSGTGVITSGSKKVALSKGMSFILTPGLEYRLTATGDKYMTFYVVTEKLPAGFTPKTDLQVVDDRSRPQTVANWYDKERPLITASDGLSQYRALTEVELKPMAMSRPYSDKKGTEEIWIATDHDVRLLLGKQLRILRAGTAYRVPATGLTAHAEINVSDEPAHFITMVR